MKNYSLNGTGFSLGIQKAPRTAAAAPVEQDANHIIVIDCSGSMYHELPKIRTQLKNRLPSLVKEKDTVTVIWFSGRNEFGTLIEGVEFATAKDLQNTNAAIDRWLKPIGLTGFKQPLEEAKKVVSRLAKTHPHNVNSVIFITDGYDNQWSKKDILDVCSVLSEDVSASTLVEYGYYCNRLLMSDMAETMGGALIFSESFSQYEPLFEQAIKRRIRGGKKIAVHLEGTPHKDVVYAIVEDQVCTFKVDNGTVYVPEAVNEVYYLTNTKGDEGAAIPNEALYAGLSVYSQRMMSDEVFAILKTVGDVRLIKQFANCFGKQGYSEFQLAAEQAVFDQSQQLTEGYDPKLIPSEDAFTVLDALAILMQDDENKFYPNHPAFNYQRTGRASVQTTDALTATEKKRVEALTQVMLTEKLTKAKMQEIKAEIDSIMETKTEGLRFKIGDESIGYSVSNLVMNETRPNVSIQVRMSGTVELPKNDYDLPHQFPTFIYRNYTIIRDGILNSKILPLSLTKETFDVFVAEGLITSDKMMPIQYHKDKVYEVNLSGVPIVNRRMIKEASARQLFADSLELETLKAKNKVYADYLKQFDVNKSPGYATLYGPETTAWLKEQGLTEYSGFSPKTTLAESVDFYMGKEIKIALKGLSSLPSLNDVRKAIDAKKKLTVSQSLIADAINEVEAIKASSKEPAFKAWLEAQLKTNRTETRALRRRLSEQKFAVVVGQIWFKEFASLDDNSLNMKLGSFDVVASVTLNEIEVKI